MKFVSEAITPQGDFVLDGTGQGQPAVPASFAWRKEIIAVTSVVAQRRAFKVDRGEKYVKRHTYDVVLGDARTATIYCERQAKRGAPRWWLFTISA